MIKTSISLPDDVAHQLSRKAPDPSRKSRLVTRALRAYFKGAAARGLDEKAVLDANAQALNAEAEEVLEFQRVP